MELSNNMEYAASNSRSMSPDVRNLVTNLIKAKRSFSSTGLSGTNAHQKYKYATIDGIFGAVENSLCNNGIWISQYCDALKEVLPNKIEVLVTRLIDSQTGQWIEDQRYLETEKTGNQAKGSAQTYMRKYAVLALCGLCPDDDDGFEEQQAIEKKKSEYSRRPMETKKSIDPELKVDTELTDFQVNILKSLLQSLPNREEVRSELLTMYHLKSLADIKSSQFNEITNYLTTIRDGKIPFKNQ